MKKHTMFFTLLILAGTIGSANAQVNQEAANTTTVLKGETLMDVSFRVYGTHKRWRELLKMNEAVIPDMNRVEPGTVLQIGAHKAVAAEPEAPPTATAAPAVVKSAPVATTRKRDPSIAHVELVPFTEMELPQ